MQLISVFAVLAFLFSAAAYVPYAKSVLTSNAQLTVSTWISWLLMNAAILAGMIAASEMAWQMVAYTVGVAVLVGASVYKGAAVGWTRLDFICLTVVIVAIGLWAVSGDPNIAIILSLVAIILSFVAITIGSVPMVVNVWENPAREPLLPWLLFLAGGGLRSAGDSDLEHRGGPHPRLVPLPPGVDGTSDLTQAASEQGSRVSSSRP
ncbi:hypothetical protein EPN83_00565 [Patescibacteria group bacterium]|nr:MAG: hypothetical protein EPN83_00565 [Patescibacteria group bacterium]